MCSPNVAPRVGAWIETPWTSRVSARRTSLPAWERGLKHGFAMQITNVGESLPAWERGLKLLDGELLDPGVEVAPRVGAWIETGVISSAGWSGLSLPAWERGLKQ